MPEPALYPCPAMSARISEEQCRINQRDARRGRPKKKSHGKRPAERNMTWLKVCLTCPGIRRLP